MRWLILVLSLFSCSPAFAEISLLERVMMSNIRWIENNTEYVYHGQDLPTLERLPQDQLVAKYYEGSKVPPPPDKVEFMMEQLKGVYDVSENTIYLQVGYDIMNRSTHEILFHEMVHFMQNINSANRGCTATMETEAYSLNLKYAIENLKITDERLMSLWNNRWHTYAQSRMCEMQPIWMRMTR